jgi:flagellar motor protein MotB
MTEGRGSREPIADNSNAQTRAKNRRVEIYVAEPAQR